MVPDDEVSNNFASPPGDVPLGADRLLEEEEIAQLVEHTIERQTARLLETEGINLSDLDDIVAGLDEEAREASVAQNPLNDTLLGGHDLDAVIADSAQAAAAHVIATPAPGLPAPPAPTRVATQTASVPTWPAPIMTSPAPPAPEPGPEAEEVSEDLLKAILAAAGTASAREQISSENLAAAATSPGPSMGDVTQEELDTLIERADPPTTPHATSAANVSERPQKPKVRRSPGRMARAAISLAVGTAVGLTVFNTLYRMREFVPQMEEVLSRGAADIENALERAGLLLDAGQYAEAVTVLDEAIQKSSPASAREDAGFMRLEARVLGFEAESGSPEFETLHHEIDTQVDAAPNHPRAAEAKHWKALLYLDDELPYAANDVYSELVRLHNNMPNFDEILIEAARLAIDLRDPTRASEYMQQLLDRFPASAHAGEARITLARAYGMAGMESESRALLVRTAQNDPNPRVRGEAVRRLGELQYEAGRHDDAVRELQTYLNAALSTEGNDEAYLLLGKSLHAAGRPAEARDTLNDLLNFFPESKVTPQAYVELSQVLETLGDRDDAVRLAQQASARYPDDPQVLSNLGLLLGLQGRPLDAATALVAAEQAGAVEPGQLLTAARHFRTAGETDRALDTYELLRREYASLPEAYLGSVEAARLLYDQGQVEEGLKQLEGLIATGATPQQRLPALVTAMDIYDDLGLDDRVSELAQDLAAAAEDPEDLAAAAEALFDSGAVHLGRQVMDRIELARLPEAKAYDLLNAHGVALLEVDPRRALERLEQAYLAYPQARKLDNDLQLLKAYLADGRAAAARRIVAEIEAHAATTTVDTPYYIDAAILYADHLFADHDYRAAADAYAAAVEASQERGNARGRERDPHWAAFQQANSLFALYDFAGSIALFDTIAASDSPWAAEAQVKAQYARLEQRLRGAPVPEPLADAAP